MNTSPRVCRTCGATVERGRTEGFIALGLRADSHKGLLIGGHVCYNDIHKGSGTGRQGVKGWKAMGFRGVADEHSFDKC